MKLSAAVLRKLMEKGLTLADVVELAEVAEESAPAADTAIERRRAYDRERMRAKREEVRRQSDDSPPTSLSPKNLTDLPFNSENHQTPIPPKTPLKGVKKVPESAFDRFWAAFPRKVAKADARKAFDKAWKKLPPFDEEQILIGGLERAKAAWTDPKFIPHAATWLNGERWNDDPATIIPFRQARDAPRPSDKFIARQANMARALAGAHRVAEEARRRRDDGEEPDPFGTSFSP